MNKISIKDGYLYVNKKIIARVKKREIIETEYTSELELNHFTGLWENELKKLIDDKYKIDSIICYM